MTFLPAPPPPWSTSPAVGYQDPSEDLTWGIDCTLLLTGAQTVTAQTVALTTIPEGTPITLTDAATVAGNVVTQRVRAGLLQPGSRYLLTAHITPSGTTNIVMTQLRIVT